MTNPTEKDPIEIMACAIYDALPGANVRSQAQAALSALTEAGLAIVPVELDPNNPEHWHKADIGISIIEENGGTVSDLATPENVIAEVYAAMLKASGATLSAKEKPDA